MRPKMFPFVNLQMGIPNIYLAKHNLFAQWFVIQASKMFEIVEKSDFSSNILQIGTNIFKKLSKP